MMNYYEDDYFDSVTFRELLDDSQYPCETVPSDETIFQTSMKRLSEIYGQFVQQTQCACIGCGYYKKSELSEGHCCKSQSTWYLHRTGCRCGLKESKYLAQKHSRMDAQLKATAKAAAGAKEESI